MLRLALGAGAGLLVAIMVIVFVETAGHVVFPPPDGIDLKDPETLKTIMKDLPLGAKLSVLFAWGLGVFAGGAAAKRIAGGQGAAVWLVAGVIAAFAGLTMIDIPHPVWMIAGAAIVVLAGAIGAQAAVRSRA